MDFRIPVLGFVVGLVVGLTGMGGGAVMTPALILLGWASPAIAVGTDLVWGTLTKAAGAFVHYRQRTVDFTIVKRLAMGSIPGAAAGLALLAYLRSQGTEAVDRLVVRMLGIALICVALSLFASALHTPSIRPANRSDTSRDPAWLTSLVGAVIGFLVSLTSVGSGSLIIASLVILYRGIPLKRIVGSDIVHALFLVGVASLGHLGIGSIDFRLLEGLLIGSIPGVCIGSRLSAVFPEKALRTVLATTLFFLGYKLL